ncbi:MAG: hypothetical protein HQ508_01080 [Candidatus Marinimicrobia bacterium]|nr:hypothetical protein [Candidatus Neomarinimicrobiota bacterium]
MGRFDLITSIVAFGLLISGFIINRFGRNISAARQHQLGFITIILILCGTIPQLRLLIVDPGLILGLGMMLFVLHLSAYYSGTNKVSAHLYSTILGLMALMLLLQSHPVFRSESFARFAVMGVVWLLFLEIERSISIKTHNLSTVERNFLWLWFLTSSASLWEPKIRIVPDILFLILLLIHFNRRWPKNIIPAPLIALYGISFMYYLHFVATLVLPLFPLALENNFWALHTVAILAGVILLLWQSFRTISLTKQLFYLFASQEVLMAGLGIENMFYAELKMVGLMRLLLFVALTGLFVMIESKEGWGLDRKLLKGLGAVRPRFTSSVIILAVLIALFPLLYLSLTALVMDIFLIIIAIVAAIWAFRLIVTLVGTAEVKNRILRASLSIWSTVVFTILLAAVVALEVVSRGYFKV